PRLVATRELRQHVAERRGVFRHRDHRQRFLVEVDGFVVALTRGAHLAETGKRAIVVRLRLERVLVSRLGEVQLPDREMLDPELPLRPGDALARTTGGLADLDRALEIRDDPRRVTADASQAGPSTVRVEVGLARHHLLVGDFRLAVAAELE